MGEREIITLKSLSIGTPLTIHFPFVSNELMILRCPIVKHIRVNSYKKIKGLHKYAFWLRENKASYGKPLNSVYFPRNVCIVKNCYNTSMTFQSRQSV